VASAAPPGAPNVILINITDAERDGVQKLLDDIPGLKNKPVVEPLVAVRLEAIDGRPVKDLGLKGFERPVPVHATGDLGGEAARSTAGAAGRLVEAGRYGAARCHRGGHGRHPEAEGRDEAQVERDRARFRDAGIGHFPAARGAHGPADGRAVQPGRLEACRVQYLGLVRLSGKQIGAFQRKSTRRIQRSR